MVPWDIDLRLSADGKYYCSVDKPEGFTKVGTKPLYGGDPKGLVDLPYQTANGTPPDADDIWETEFRHDDAQPERRIFIRTLVDGKQKTHDTPSVQDGSDGQIP